MVRLHVHAQALGWFEGLQLELQFYMQSPSAINSKELNSSDRKYTLEGGFCCTVACKVCTNFRSHAHF